jgi:hypothetical protein
LEERGNQHIYEENNMQKGGLDTKPINASLDELARKEIQEESHVEEGELVRTDVERMGAK